jgi:hypothetical protein
MYGFLIEKGKFFRRRERELRNDKKEKHKKLNIKKELME